MSAKLFGMRRL